MFFRVSLTWIACAFFTLHAYATPDGGSYREITSKAPFLKPATCPSEVWVAMQPHFLPENHALRVKLDRIFSKQGVLMSPKNLKKAGFLSPYPRKSTQVIVSAHPRIPGHLIKAYLDVYDEQEWKQWLRRIQGAQLVQSDLDGYGYNGLIKVPKKWVYPLPAESVAAEAEGVFPKHFILVVQDVGVLSEEGNEYGWRYHATRELLTAIFLIISKNQMYDSVRIANIPFCFDGRVAFVDTEQSLIPMEIRFWKLYEYLSSEMLPFFKGLVENGIPES